MSAYTFTIPNLPGGMQITCTADSQKDAIKEAHFWQSLPTECPIDGTPTIFCFREPSDNHYYSVISTGFPQYEYKIGQHKTGGTLFAKEEWVHYDGERETVLWSRGKLTPAGERLISGQKPTPRPAQTPPPATPAPSTNGNGHKAPASSETPAAAPTGYPERLQPLYGDQWPTALAVLCRAASLGKRSNPADLILAQLQQLENKIAIRETLHEVGRQKYGDKWPAALHKAVRGRNELYDLDAELSDEQVQQMIAGLRTPEKMAA